MTQTADTQDPFALARDAAAVIADRTGVASHDVALVLGSGWGQTADRVGRTVATVEQAEVPGFAAAAVAGHSGQLRSVEIADTGRRALVFGTRTHFYEGRGVRAVVHAVRTAAAAGCRAIVLTNGCGGLRPEWGPGTPVLISDHINLTATSPVEGANFVDLTDLYSPACASWPARSTPTSTRASTRSSAGRTTRPPRRCAWPGSSAPTSSACRRRSRRSPRARPASGPRGLARHQCRRRHQRDSLAHDEVVAAGQAAAERCGTLLASIVARI